MNAIRPLPHFFRFLVGYALVLSQLSLGRADDVIRERYPSGPLSEERHVVLDPHGNYVNHGPLRRWSPDGELLLEGRYAHGLPEGTWTQRSAPSRSVPLDGRASRRWTDAESPALSNGQVATSLAGFCAAGFQTPFVSRADFDAGKLSGTWMICDAQQRPCVAIEFLDGQRHGDATWHGADGSVVLRETYRDGRLEGEVMRYSPESKAVVWEGPYVHGYLISPRLVAGHPQTRGLDDPGLDDPDLRLRPVRQAEGGYALGPAVLEGIDDFWTSQVASARLGDGCLPHGWWRNWRPSGQIRFQGAYYLGRPVGKFTWWRDNGLTACSGQFAAGRPSGTWTWWDAQGILVAQRSLSDPGEPDANPSPADRRIARAPKRLSAETAGADAESTPDFSTTR